MWANTLTTMWLICMFCTPHNSTSITILSKNLELKLSCYERHTMLKNKSTLMLFTRNCQFKADKPPNKLGLMGRTENACRSYPHIKYRTGFKQRALHTRDQSDILKSSQIILSTGCMGYSGEPKLAYQHNHLYVGWATSNELLMRLEQAGVVVQR